MTMTEDGAKITLRMGNEEIQMMEDFMADRNIGNRSDFIRDAIRGYIESERNDGPGAGAEDGLFVRLTEVQKGTLELLAQDGMCVSAEEYARKCILDRIIPADAEKDAVSRAFQASYMASKMK
jgi:Arc/MetJ-type ribon-helix-helix transcriptional regulator